jgi:hypothetical protein
VSDIFGDFALAVDGVSLGSLRRHIPDVQWTAHRSGFGWAYKGSDGSVVRACSAMSPRYDGDDDTFRTEWYRYYADGRPAELV